MDQLFDKIPYDTLEDVPAIQVLAGAAGVGLLIFVAAYFTVFGAINTEFETLAKKKTETENKLNSYRTIVANKDSTFKKLVKTMGDLSIVKRQMPNQETLNKLLKKITVLGKKRDIDVMIFRMKEGKLMDFYKEIPLEITLRGGLWGTMDMFAALQNMLRLVDVENLKFSVENVVLYRVGGGTEPIGETPMLVSKFTAKTFVYIDGSEEKSK
ncbi:hypothetical protein UR09_00515 [Candidatus Nitromaritima sp. SCGC AAA799-A02]|nr:hypothetical protein UR09_00515 [Candidatus Nitromaritima sp. SCGC AAA799-A02]